MFLSVAVFEGPCPEKDQFINYHRVYSSKPTYLLKFWHDPTSAHIQHANVFSFRLLT